jgi:2-hydroxy-6-oxonona-2,4-dienedioate hydrolase
MAVDELTESASSRFAQTKKWRIHYNEAGSGSPVIMLHGSGPGASGWSNFKSNIGVLGHDHRVLALDMPGWGKTDTAPPGDRDHVEALVLFLDEVGIDKAAIVGNSMGGMTALRFAVEHPDRISHLIPMGAPVPGVNIFSPGGGSEGGRALFAAYHDPSPEKFKELVTVMAYDSRFATDELSQERSANALANPEHLKSFLDAAAQGAVAGPMAAFANLQAQLAQVETPTLVIHGRDDRTVPFENGLRLVSIIPNSRLLVLNRCGHWAQLEHADEFNRTVAAFIANN